MFTSIEVLPPQQVESTTVSSHPSILSTLAHVIGVEWIWLRRWLGEIQPAREIDHPHTFARVLREVFQDVDRLGEAGASGIL